MLFKRHDRQWIGQFDRLMSEPGIIHGFSTRKGGVSSSPFDFLNLGINTADKQENVHYNRNRFYQAISVQTDRLVMPQQVHENHVAVVTEPGEIPRTDAVITQIPELALSIQIADCVPIFLYYPLIPCIGLVHAGWRGTVRKIAQKTVQAMTDHLNADPSDLLAFIGPSIGPCCYEVGNDVKSCFDPTYLNQDHLDLWECNKEHLVKSGIPVCNIQVSGICTRCNNSMFFSHRESGGETGRMMAVMMIL